MTLTLQQLETHLLGAANILRGKNCGAGLQELHPLADVYKRLCDQWECEGR